MTYIRTTINKTQERALKRTLAAYPNKHKMVERRAVNQVGGRERTLVVSTTRTLVNIKSSSLKKSNVVLTKASGNRIGAHLAITGGRIPLIEFSARQVNKGASYQITKTEPRKMAPSAFIQTMRSGHIGVFKRQGDSRTPLTELRGASIPQILQNELKFRKDVQENRVANDLQNELKKQADLIISRAK